MITRRNGTVLAWALTGAVAAAQSQGVAPGAAFEFEIDPGTRIVDGVTVPRAAERLIFEWAIDGRPELVAARRVGDCRPFNAPDVTCTVFLPALTEGSHVLKLRARDPDGGVPPSGFSPQLFVVVNARLVPDRPRNLRRQP